MIELNINGQAVSVDVEPDTPLLWVLREQLGMTGTKFGCGIGMCGACTVHFGGVAMRSCVLPVGGAAGIPITTIEGLAEHPVQEAWIAEQVPQCGYCQSGQIMAAAAMLAQIPRPTDADIDAQMTNLCRCATYDRIRAGIKRAAESIPLPPPPEPEPEVESAPVDGAPVDGAPAEGAPVDAAPADGAPVEAAPLKAAPSEPTEGAQ